MRKFGKKEILEVVKDCRVFVPRASTFSYEELIDFAWTKGYMDISKMSDLSILYLYDKLMSLRVANDCFGKYFEANNEICNLCQLSKRCKVISRIPSRELIPRDHKSNTISLVKNKTAIVKKVKKVKVRDQKKHKQMINSLDIDVEKEDLDYRDELSDLLKEYNKFLLTAST